MSRAAGPLAHAAIDLGAESGRVVLGWIEQGRLAMREVHRFGHAGIEAADGGLTWDLERLWGGIVEGLAAAGRAAIGQGLRIASVGADTWGVDFVLLDEKGSILAPPRCYRDPRHFRAMDRVLAAHGPHRLYRTSGAAPMFFNTVFQLVAMRDEEPQLLAAARSLLFMPDVVHWKLTGRTSCETTIASTSGLVDARTGAWSADLLGLLGLPGHMLGPITPCAAPVGRMDKAIAEMLGLPDDVQVVAPAGHDTACAVAAVPADPTTRWAYLSSGTWSLIGLERHQPLLTDEACDARLTNEGGPAGTTRLLRNVVGLWLIQEYRRELERLGERQGYEHLVRLAESAEPMHTLFDASDARLHAPGDMAPRIAALATEAGEPTPRGPGELVRACFESLALEYARTLRGIERIASTSVDVLHVVGGGSQNDFLNQCTANATGCTVVAGPVESTAAGNLLLQAVGLGIITPDDVRRVSRDSFAPRRFLPQPDEARRWADARVRYDRARTTAAART